jgi:hypothetical protein
MLLGWNDDTDEKIELSPDVLLRHVAILGASGSGKTVTCKVLVEEAVRHNIPVIAIDPQGDIASLCMIGDIQEAIRRGVPLEVAKGYWDKVDVKIWTPGSSYGLPICVSPIATIPDDRRPEDRVRAFAAVASSLASLVDCDAPETVSAFSHILEWADSHGYLIENLTDFADWLIDPPQKLADDIDEIFSARDRRNAARKVRAKTMGASRLMFSMGTPINIPLLLGRETGAPKDKVRVSIICLNTLASQEEKEFFVAALANAMYAYMLGNPTPGRVQGIFYLDEAAPFLPPVRKPASKEPLMLLLRQARKYGISCMVATQSPGDLDYKGLAQVNTWILGRMTTYQEAAKVEGVLRSMPGVDANAIIDSLPGLQKGKFIVASPDAFPVPFRMRVRYLITRHTTLPESQLEAMVSAKDREAYG